MANKIRWSRSDSITLGKAVSNFNKTVQKLEQEESNLLLPDVISFKDLKSDITTRKELNRIIKSLKRFQLPNQQEAVKTEGDVELTRWELTEVKRAKTRATKRLTGELAGIESRSIGTGNIRANEIRATLKSYEKVETSSLDDFKRISASILRQGRTDYEFKKALIFQQNFITAYEKMGRKEVVEMAKMYKNPLDFWEAIQNSELTDIKLRYDVEEGRMSLAMSKDDSYYLEVQKLIKNYYESL